MTSAFLLILNVSLSSSEQVTSNFWTDPANGNPYYIAVQTPEHRESSLGEIVNTPVSRAGGDIPTREMRSRSPKR
jgi:hypothetical protein